MINTKKQAIFFSIIAGYILLCIISIFQPKKDENFEISVDTPESSFFQEGNVQSRQDYEAQMLVDPSTGSIPNDIRRRELAFSKSIQDDLIKIKTRLSKAEGNSSNSTLLQNWQGIGPTNVGGRTRAVALDVLDENIILAGGVSGGIWRSTNLGQNWTRVSGVNQVQSVTTITQDIRPGKENIWYYGTGELVGNSARAPGAPFRGDGIYKSTDRGMSWQPLISTQANTPGFFGSPFQYVWDITTNPNSANDEVLAAVYGGIVRTTDGGQSWTTVLGTNLLNVTPGTDLNDVPAIFYTDLHRTSSGVFFASLSSATNQANTPSPAAGVYRSEDGVNWTQVLNYAGQFVQRIEIGSSRTNPDLLYFLADLSGGGYALWRYTTNGVLANLTLNVPDGSNDIESFDSQESYNMVVAIHPNNDNIVYIGGTNLYRSTDGFSSRRNTTWIGGYAPDADGDVVIYDNHHPDQHALIFLPSDGNKMISANDGGLFLTNDNTATSVSYTPLNNGFITTQFYSATYSRYAPDDFVVGGTQDNGSILTFNTADANPNGMRVIGGDGGFTASTPFGAYYYLSFQNSRIFRLTLNNNARITSFARVDPEGGGSDPSQPYLFINPYVLDPNNSNRMYLAGGDFVWFNRNLSQIAPGSQSPATLNWTKLESTEVTDGGIISAIQVSTEPRDIVYYGTSTGRLFKIINANTSVYQVEEITGAEFPENAYIKAIAVDPTDANHITVGFANYGVKSIFRSTDGGDSFEHISGNLEENPDGSGNGPSIRWLSILPTIEGGSTIFYAGTSTGLYSALLVEGDNTLWEKESPDGIGNSVVNMIDYRRSDGKMVVATHGNGLYTSQVPNVVPDDPVSIAGSFSFDKLYPNPFNDQMAIKLLLPQTQFVIIRIYDTSGNQVKLVTSSLGFAGENEFFWDGTDVYGNPVANGVYIVRVTYLGQSESKAAILQR